MDLVGRALELGCPRQRIGHQLEEGQILLRERIGRAAAGAQQAVPIAGWPDRRNDQADHPLRLENRCTQSAGAEVPDQKRLLRIAHVLHDLGRLIRCPGIRRRDPRLAGRRPDLQASRPGVWQNGGHVGVERLLREARGFLHEVLCGRREERQRAQLSDGGLLNGLPLELAMRPPALRDVLRDHDRAHDLAVTRAQRREAHPVVRRAVERRPVERHGLALQGRVPLIRQGVPGPCREHVGDGATGNPFRIQAMVAESLALHQPDPQLGVGDDHGHLRQEAPERVDDAASIVEVVNRERRKDGIGEGHTCHPSNQHPGGKRIPTVASTLGANN